MINNDKISVLITSHKARFNTLNRVIGSWLTQPVDEIWVIDDGNNFKTEIKDPRLLIFNMPKDFETKSDYVLSILSDGDLIVLADDDIIVYESFLIDLYNGYKKTKNSIVGIYGKRCLGPHYLKDTKRYKSKNIENIEEVDFIGILFMCERKYFNFDVRGMHKNCDDLWFSMKIHSNIKKYVIPTKKYIDLPCSSNKTAMYKNQNIKKPRYNFYTEYYNLNLKKNPVKLWKQIHSNNIK